MGEEPIAHLGLHVKRDTARNDSATERGHGAEGGGTQDGQGEGHQEIGATTHEGLVDGRANEPRHHQA